jgi:RND family efflux transporter MFP subunit
MNIRKLAIVALLLTAIISLSACSLGQNTTAQAQIAVTRGDMTVKVNGNGKTSYASNARLSFGIEGQVSGIFVKKGDAVDVNQVMAQLDTSAMELELSQVKVAEAAAKVNVSQAEMAVTRAEIEANQAQAGEARAESAITQAEAQLTAAQMAFDKIQAVKDIKDKITVAEWQKEAAIIQIGAAARLSAEEADYWRERYEGFEAESGRQSLKLAKLLAKDEYGGVATYEIEGEKYDRLIVEDVQLKARQIKIAEESINLAKLAAEQVRQDTKLSGLSIESSRQNAEQASLVLEQSTKAAAAAGKKLEYAQIIAPFGGLITGLEIKKGDFIVTPGTSAGMTIDLVDTNSLEINTEVDEIDIADVRVGQKALIKLDALHSAEFEGVVSSIPVVPVTNPQNPGVVVYAVKVRFAGIPPEGARSGMSASVDIITHEEKGLLLVPNKSLKRNAQGQTVINVVSGQKTEEHPIVIGLTDGVNTQVISGLQEGDLILQLAPVNLKQG